MSSLAPVRSARAATWARLGRWRLVALILLALVGLAPSAYLAQTSDVVVTGYTIQRRRAERDAWRVRNQQLEVELAKARSLGWIETDAVARLGMRPPTGQTVVRLDTPPPPPSHAPSAGRSPRTTSPWTSSSPSAPPTRP